jgi:predicted acyl esterase
VPEHEDGIVDSGNLDELIADGYIFVWQNIRGRFKSEGEFVMNRPPRDRHDPRSIDEGTDTYDTIDWLLKNVPGNNGMAGLWGISYPGWLVTQALLEPHPSLKAASEQASPDDMFVNDDFHHNGTFRLSYGFEYAALLESSKEKKHALRLRPVRHLRLVSQPGRARERRSALFPRQAPYLEQLCRTS